MSKEKLLKNIELKILTQECRYGLIRLDHIMCNDDFTFSIQFGCGKYCNTYNATNKYQLLTAIRNPSSLTFEVGYPSSYEELLAPYDNEDVVYSHVPLDVIGNIITKHKGIKQIAKGLIKI